MICKNPYALGDNAFGCGQCTPCRINRRRLWTHRLVLESYKHEHSCFVTLTYNDEHLPTGGNLSPADLRNYIKRLRKLCSPIKLRFYAVGEYGDRTQRPHYHLLVYGIGEGHTQTIADAWSIAGKALGHVVVGTLTFESAGYVSGYVTKKMTKADDPRLNGRHPEFARMSNRPGIGAAAMDDLANLLFTKHGSKQLALTGDVPTSLKHGSKNMPLGRYLRRKLREKVGLPELGFDSPAAIQQRETLRSLLEGKNVTSQFHKKILITQAFAQKVRQIETRVKIHQKEKSL